MKQKVKIFLLPGELHISREPALISTLLGSCVAVTLFNYKLKCGGMNHFMLPACPEGGTCSGKHGDYSTQMLIETMLSYDNSIKHIEACVFGGANVNDYLAFGKGIGAKNIIAAGEILKRYNIKISKKAIGGTFGRKIYFNTDTGEFDIKKIQNSTVTQ